jgi:hypothetical protein
MSFVTFLPLVLALGICFFPVWLLRYPDHRRAQDYFVSSQYTRPEVVRNSSIAYALRMAAFGPLFAWGASGDLWPAIIGSAFFGLGVYLIYILRQPLLEFLDGALSRDQSITVHEFIARQHGNDPRVRLLAASLTVFALLGLLVGEALGVAAFLKPMLPGSGAAVYLFVFAALLLMVLHAILSGHSGVMHSAQLQLGMLYLGLFGSTALLLYLHVSALTPMPPHGTFAVVFVAVCCAIMLYYRRSKYVDTDPIRRATSNTDPGHQSSGARLLSRFEKILNPCLSVLVVLIIVVALMEFYAAGLPTIVRDSAAALQKGTRVPGVGLIALCLLPLFYPLVDVTNWQRLAAVQKDMSSSGVEPGRRSAVLRGVFGIYAVESSLVWLFMCMLGAIAVIAIETPDGADVLQVFVAQLISEDNEVTVVALPLLLICVFAVALSTMSALFSASLCTIRYDMLAAVWPELAPGQGQASKEPTATRLTLIAGGGLGLAFAAAFCVADASLQISFTSSTFIALLFAFCCAQLSFAPLVLGPIVGRTRSGFGTVSAGWALVILGFGAASGVAAVTVYLATGTEAWLWAAVPACLGSGLVLFAIARAASGSPGCG